MRLAVTLVGLVLIGVACARAGDPTPLAWTTFKAQAHERYDGTPYLWLGHGRVALSIAARPAAGQVIDLLWGAKDDERGAVITINGRAQTVRAGGYAGFRWQRVVVPAGVSGSRYTVTIEAGELRAGFIAAVRLADATLPLDAPLPSDAGGAAIGVEFEKRAAEEWPAVEPITLDDPLLRHAEQASRALRQSRLFVQGWLAHADPVSGLIPRNLGKDRDIWNGRDCGADNYPFMVLTCALTDRAMYEGRMLQMLRTEQRLTSRVDRLVDAYSFSRQGFAHAEADIDRIIFDSSEYVKDGLMPITEWLGRTAWSERMIGLIDDIWKHAPVQTPFGRIPAVDNEVNGEIMQVSARMFWWTGDRKYLDQACRIADYYLIGEHHPTRDSNRLRLRDHGCELISGLTEVYFACHHAAPDKARAYRRPLHQMLDRILEVGVNEHGMMYNQVDPQSGKVLHTGLSDNWGYNYNGFYTVYLLDGVERYRQAVRRALGSLDAHYRGYPWEGRSHDGYADSIECAINLYNREPIDSAARWIDSQMRIMLAMQKPDGVIGGWHGDGNFARTAIMYALWKQQGATVEPWREDVKLGAAREGEALKLAITATAPWQGRVVFDAPRHKTVMRMPLDYPRINQFPEWFTVDAGHRFQVAIDGRTEEHTGQSLLEGLPVRLEAGQTLRLSVSRIGEALR